MRSLGVLCRAEMHELLRSLSGGSKKSRKLTVLSVLLPFLVMIFMSLTYSTGMVQFLGSDGLFIYMALSAVFLMILFSAMSISGFLFQKRSLERLLVLPVSETTMIIAKLLSFYCYLLLLDLCYLIPYAIAEGLVKTKGGLLLLVALFLPMIPLAIAGLFAMLFHKVSSGHRMPVLIKYTILIAGLLLLIIGISYAQSKLFTNANSAQQAQEQLLSLPVLGWYFKGIGGILAAIFAQIAIFIIFVVLLQVFSWKKEEIQKKQQKVALTTTAYDGGSQLKSLFLKEKSQYFGIPVYVLNTIISPVLIVGLTIALVIKPSLLSRVAIGNIAGIFPILLLLLSSFILMCCTSGSSISLEGSNLYMLKTFPIPAIKLFQSKILWNVILMLPISLLCILCLGIRLSMNPFEIVLLLFAAVVLSFFIAVFGVAINLKFSMLDYTNPTVVVKQSASTMICTFGGIGITTIAGIILFAAEHPLMILVIYYFVLFLLTIAMYRYLVKRGEYLLERL